MAIYDLGGNIIQSAFGVEGNALSQAYDINGNALMSNIVFDDSTTVTNVYTSTINAYPQGGCMDDDGNLCACLLTTSQFIKHNIATGNDVLYSFTPDAYGHGNGMAYNPNNERFYVASMKDTGEVYVFNKSFTLVDTLYPKDSSDNTYVSFNICYNRFTKQFIILAEDNYIRFYDDNFDLVSQVAFDISEWKYTRQDSETDGNYIYAVSYNPNALFVFDFEGNMIKEISNTGFGGEPENLCYDWHGKYYMSGKDSRFVIRRLEFIET